MPTKATADKRTLTRQLLATAAAACDDKKGEDIRILALDPADTGLGDYLLICTGNSDRQNTAITDEIELRLKREFGTYPASVEGRRQGEWILMDYFDFVVHVFTAEKRAFYGLERLRKTATSVTVAELNDEIKAAITATRKKATSTAVTTKATKSKTTNSKASTGRTAPVKAKTAGTSVAKKAAAKKTAAKKTLVKSPSAKKAIKAAVASKKAVKKSPKK